MDLSSILDDIASPADTPTAAAQATEVGALEHLAVLPVLMERATQVQNHLHTHRLVASVLKDASVSKATALEVFAMLPVQQDETMLLTAATTEHNHRLVLKASASLQSNPQEAEHLVQEVSAIVNKTLDATEALRSLCQHCGTDIERHLNTLKDKPAIVIWNNQSVNLLTGDIAVISRIDSYALDYAPYAGVIDAKFRAIENAPLLQDLIHQSLVLEADGGHPSLGRLALYLVQCAQQMQESLQELSQMGDNLNRYLKIDAPDKVLDTHVPKVLDTLAQIKQHEKLFAGEGSLASLTLDCLSTLV